MVSAAASRPHLSPGWRGGGGPGMGSPTRTSLLAAPNQCDLNCLAEGHAFYHSFGRVLDGTPCSPGAPGLCVAGRCLVRTSRCPRGPAPGGRPRPQGSSPPYPSLSHPSPRAPTGPPCLDTPLYHQLRPPAPNQTPPRTPTIQSSSSGCLAPPPQAPPPGGLWLSALLPSPRALAVTACWAQTLARTAVAAAVAPTTRASSCSAYSATLVTAGPGPTEPPAARWPFKEPQHPEAKLFADWTECCLPLCLYILIGQYLIVPAPLRTGGAFN